MEYLNSTEGITPDHLHGFFVNWPNPPTPGTHLRLLRNSDVVVLAVDTSTGQVVGFITAITDGVLAAYIPFLEVLPAYQHQGIGQTLVRRMLERLQDLYMIDLLCDADVQSFYEQFGMYPAGGMCLRNYARQSGQEKTTAADCNPPQALN
ncbi:MAG: GNAT family N-acetyltransferase [Anaerolineae bacterium]|nr:GNAT family N-acetyltransferase [Anaerolineae bacterium]